MQLATEMALVRDHVRRSNVSLGCCPFCQSATDFSVNVVEFTEWGVSAHPECVSKNALMERPLVTKRESFVAYLVRSFVSWISLSAQPSPSPSKRASRPRASASG